MHLLIDERFINCYNNAIIIHEFLSPDKSGVGIQGRNMKKIRTIYIFLCLAVALSAFAPAARAETVDQSVVSGCHTPDAALQLSETEQLVETSKAVLVYELQSDTMIYGWNADERIYPSSMVKLMTALLVLENAQLDDRVVVTKRALSYVEIGSVSAGLVAGEELSVTDLLYCLMTASANDAATVLAEHVAGNQDTFVRMMNQRAAELGCVGTNYTNAHGLHDENCYTTARDICRLMVEAMKVPMFRELLMAINYTVPATNKSEERVIYTTNYMSSNEKNKKYLDSRVLGGKTGATDEGGRCFTAVSSINGMEILTIVMGATPEYEDNGLALKRFGSFEETKVLLDHVQERYEYRQIFFEGQIIAQYPVENGENSVTVQPQYVAATVLPIGTDVSKLTWIYGDSTGVIRAPVKAGQVITVAQVWQGSKCLAQTPLVAVNAVDVWREPVIPEKPESNDGELLKNILIIAGIVFGAAVIVIGVIFGVRLVRSRAVQKRHRRRRTERRRSR